MGIKRFGKKFIGSIKRFGNKHKGKVAVVGALAVGGAAAYGAGEEDRIKNNAARRAEEIMNTIDKDRESEAQEAHDKLMKEKAVPQPQSGFAPKPAKPPGLIQTAKNIPGAIKQAEKSAQKVTDAKVLKKSKEIQQGATDVLSAASAPSKKEQKRVSQEQRFLEGQMSDKEAEEFIKKQGGRKAARKSKKAEKQARKRKKKKEKNK
jgi:hypothetical protein